MCWGKKKEIVNLSEKIFVTIALLVIFTMIHFIT